MNRLIDTTYSKNDVIILLKDLSGCIEAQSTEEREHLIQSGVHYSEMLPLEYKPTEDYLEIYNKSLSEMSKTTAICTALLAEKLYNKHAGKFVIISLARAGIPVGILVKRYLRIKYNINLPHYSISIIRGKGIDINAMEFIKDGCEAEYGVGHFQFLDGWTGKGVITNELSSAVKMMKESSEGWRDLSDELAVLADPANICTLCGTHRDFLIPSACLNGTVSGLISRTILRSDLIDTKKGDFHGGVYFKDLENEDKSNEFIDKVTSYFTDIIKSKIDLVNNDDHSSVKGIDIVKSIAKEYNINDINLIKPGVGETTRVLLRRVPWKVLIDNSSSDTEGIEHIIRLCKEKSVPIEYKSLGGYRTCGIIKDMSADL